MSKLLLDRNKNLKLTNVVIGNIYDKGAGKMGKRIEQMDNYIKSKGATPVGPLIQYTNTYLNRNGDIEINVKVMRQASSFIYNVEKPYNMESVIRVKNCLYVRYAGPESKIKFAYDKIMLTAFEEDIPLKGDSYTIFVDRQDDHIVADVFMEKADNE